jgi:hypothetical protein
MSVADVVLVCWLLVIAAAVVVAVRRGRRPADVAAIKPPEGASNGTYVGRLEELEDKYNRLDRRFTRIQGEFNALTRMSAETEEDVNFDPREGP